MVEEEPIPMEAPPVAQSSGEVRVLGVGDLLTRLASDCLPPREMRSSAISRAIAASPSTGLTARASRLRKNGTAGSR